MNSDLQIYTEDELVWILMDSPLTTDEIIFFTEHRNPLFCETYGLSETYEVEKSLVSGFLYRNKYVTSMFAGYRMRPYQHKQLLSDFTPLIFKEL